MADSPDPIQLSHEVLGALHPSEPVYAVLDGARSLTVSRWAVETKAPAWCLYRGELNPDIAEIAPYLLRMGRGHPYIEAFFRQGWQQSWGVLLSSAAPSRELRTHLRKYLKVLTEDNRAMMFRWYDPRVLRVYLPTCTEAELKHFFGPVSAFAAPTGDPKAFEVFRLSEGKLQRHAQRL